MTDILSPYLNKISKQKTPCLVFGILSIFLAILGFALSILFYTSLGKVWFYVISLFSLVGFGFLALFLIKRYIFVSYLLSFWEEKKKNPLSFKGVYISNSSYTVDKHFSSYKLKFEDGEPLFWYEGFGEIPFEKGKSYSLELKGNWVSGWEEGHE